MFNDGAITECRHSSLSAVVMYIDAGDWEKTTSIKKARDAKLNQVKKLADDDHEGDAFESQFQKVNPYTSIADVESQLKAILGDTFGTEEVPKKGKGKGKTKSEAEGEKDKEKEKDDKVITAAVGYQKAQAMATLLQSKLALVEEVQAQLASSRYSSPALIKDTFKIVKELKKESANCKDIFIQKSMELAHLANSALVDLFCSNICFSLIKF